ncbi:ppGpp synthetase catalytic domain (RelA/SpoT-type nucleotidyltranferase) (YjbM) (PDB:5F2V) [Commensalibacter communis]|uniref:RelA/SpoT domain-containing protein n=1 Tax=Commensalibacter communis TaxID=2972786 RepID=UPI0022FFB6B2|nr:RelA/SpoT domain-containing protein [Commensalibacter communis]CAI3942533.1 ppGpp synthetase catalytic domain (RelA/SpoT-type nucleotidyltranferase) (YjbM) (PDB:5F2V) [Commensalibacter communis]CAI3943817.1 ppGpp synthetase catalytic domain (RelA/SpoT-type nucleotidyltranferase) (YjbM) (PDB:5F2V) [Commensalibacter communis]
MAQENMILETFLEHYKREYNFYYDLAKLVSDQCEKMLQKRGIRAIVTFRAKKAKSLKEKIYQRHKTASYQSEKDIREDIVDLAGVRIALYFPKDRELVNKFLKDTFIIVEEKTFPNSEHENIKDKTRNKFDGYHANHYRVTLQQETLEDKNKDCVNHIVEIQVASILMHAWSEVNHDLAYKPSSGILSQQELSILDGLNGLVLTGEVLLEQLQPAFEKRVIYQRESFADEYELATFICKRLETRGLFVDLVDIIFGRIDILFNFLVKKELNNPDDVHTLINKLDADIDVFPIVDKIFDILFEKDIDSYYLYYDLLTYDRKDRKIGADYGHLEFFIQILEKQIVLRRYVSCLAYYKNIKEDGLKYQEEALRNLGEFKELFYNLCINDLVTDIFYCVHNYNYAGLNLNKLRQTIIESVNQLEQFDNSYSKKAMEWARSGQLELPEK